MKVCFFGIFDPDYARNRVLIQGFKRNGHDVVLCRIDPNKKGVLRKYWELYKEYKRLSDRSFDYVIVAFPGHTVVWLAYVLWGRRIVFDVFVSLYNSEVEDRGYHHILSLRAFYYWFLDWYSMHVAGILLMETDSHIDFLVHKFHVSRSKFIKVYVGSDNQRVFPQVHKKDTDECIVVFFGTGIPLQGIPYIVAAAQELREYKNMRFLLYGPKDNIVFQKVIASCKLPNVEFKGPFERDDINDVVKQADIVLGIFGDTQKTQLVIPNKAYETWAACKPLISANTPAMQELAQDTEHVLLCQVADSGDLAEKIRYLCENKVLREQIARNGFEMYNRMLRPEILVTQLIKDLEYR